MSVEQNKQIALRFATDGWGLQCPTGKKSGMK